MNVDDHCTILAASEQLDKVLPRLKDEVMGADLAALELTGILIWLSAAEGVADFLREKANVIAETQP